MPTLGSSYLAGPTVVAWGSPKGGLSADMFPGHLISGAAP